MRLNLSVSPWRTTVDVEAHPRSRRMPPIGGAVKRAAAKTGQAVRCQARVVAVDPKKKKIAKGTAAAAAGAAAGSTIGFTLGSIFGLGAALESPLLTLVTVPSCALGGAAMGGGVGGYAGYQLVNNRGQLRDAFANEAFY
jgi:hypothetical protein